jgi:hypothetical protein
MLGTMIMLNLFTGVIINSMQEAQANQDETVLAAAKATEKIPHQKIEGEISSVDEKLRAISQQLHAVSQDIAALRERTA